MASDENVFAQIQKYIHPCLLYTSITFVLCYELISMVTERNNLHDTDTWMFFKWVFKAFVAVYLVTNTFNITMAIFDVGQRLVSAAAGVIGGNTSLDVAGTITTLELSLIHIQMCIRDRFKELQTVKRNIDQILRQDEPHRRKEQSHER